MIMIPGLVVTTMLINKQGRMKTAARSDQQNSEAVGNKPAGNRTPVIVELFTSEGCSSCPPADEVLARLERTQPVEGVEIIPLGEHVDYWNYIGWSDPFSSSVFSERQGAYSEAFGRDGAYTPQMVVDGRTEFVGSNWSKAVAAISQAARTPKAEVKITFTGKAPGTVKFQLRTGNLAAVTPGDKADLFLAITEGNLSSNVSRGENAGRRLNHATVVRLLNLVNTTDSRQRAASSSESTVTLSKDWKQENLRVVAFIQERGSRRVIGAGTLKMMSEQESNSRD